MKISRLASPANLGGALYQSFLTLTDTAACSRRVLSGSVRYLLAGLSIALTCWVGAATAPPVGLVWNANPESNISDYRISYGSAPGIYPNEVSVGTTLSASISGLSEGSTYYFVVSAVNQAGQQSEVSTEVSYQIPVTTLISPASWTLKYADSQESTEYQASKAFDGDPNTMWHTAWSGTTTPPPHELQINLGGNQSICGFRYLPRSGNLLVGNVGQYELYVSQDGVNWSTPVASGTFPNTGDLKEVRFAETIARYIRFRALTDANGGTYTSIAELSLIQGSAILPPNQAPIAAAKTLSTREGTPVAVTLSGTDAEGNTLAYAVVKNPAKGTLTGTAPNLTYTPSANFSGSDSFTYLVNDGTVNSAAATVSLTITPVNHAPVATAKSVTTAEDSVAAITLQGTDPDNNSLTYSIVSVPSHGVLSGNAPNLTFTPAANYNGADQFTFQVKDGILSSAPATVSITISPVNDAPVATSRALTTEIDTSLPITLGGSDLDGNALTYSVVSGPSQGTLTGTPPNLSYQPVVGFSGSDQFTFKANDGSLNSAPATISVTVTPKTPSAGVTVLPRNGWSLKFVDSQETFDSPGSYAFDGDPFTFWHTQWRTGTLPTLPHEIQINLGAVQSICGFRYLPRQDGHSIGNIANYEFYVSTDGVNWGNPVAIGTFANDQKLKQITFTSKSGQFIRLRAISEANGNSDTCIAELNLLTGAFTNAAPTASAQSIITEKDTPVAVVLTGGDPDGNALTFSIAEAPAHGSLTGTFPNLTYTPQAGFTGDDSFTFRTNDGAINSSPAIVLVTVNSVPEVPGNVAPVFTAALFTATATEDQPSSGQLTATDENSGDALTFRKLTGPAWLSVAADGTFSGTPGNANAGENRFTVKVTDPNNASSTAALVITVANVNDAPIFKVNPIIYPAGTEKVDYREQTLGAIAYDPDLGDKFSYSIVSGPEWLAISESGSLKGTPPRGSAGLNSFTVRATDASGAFAEGLLQIKINPNTLPLPWKLDRVGIGMAGPALYSAGVFTMGGAGSLDATSDAGNFGWQTLSGDGQIVARVDQLDSTGPDTRVGLMIRDSLTPQSRQVFIGVNGSGKLRWLRRYSNGGEANETSTKAPNSGETWLKLVRKGDKIAAFKSKNGEKWTKAGYTTLHLPENCYIGLSVSSGDKDLLNTSKFSHVRVTP